MKFSFLLFSIVILLISLHASCTPSLLSPFYPLSAFFPYAFPSYWGSVITWPFEVRTEGREKRKGNGGGSERHYNLRGETKKFSCFEVSQVVLARPSGGRVTLEQGKALGNAQGKDKGRSWACSLFFRLDFLTLTSGRVNECRLLIAYWKGLWWNSDSDIALRDACESCSATWNLGTISAYVQGQKKTAENFMLLAYLNSFCMQTDSLAAEHES